MTVDTMADTPENTVPKLPRSEAEAQACAARHGWTIPAPCLPGVVANLDLLARHAAIFAGKPA
ncbi:hypothetical protein [Novosphingobium pokkalii]|uniref:Uncharacterized protein n=1 Tax=Novosphingobium pokkalii TaxID=1770194 RepID=A0ABV7V2K3_9SPHN|nr:hypothetical protein [Novosphingobium pokkalii]GHC82611.1 hypothetical protein GCM10019060_01360 [Novosphingobium pokkalii]